jgi:protein SCO1/2
MARLRLILWLVAGAAVVVAGIYAALGLLRDEPAGPHFGGPFSLTTASGETFTQADLAGSATLLYFGYTYCPDVCPTTLAETTGWRRELGLSPSELKIVFVTVDPRRDTQAQMALYVSSFDHVIGLTGDADAIDQIKADYAVYSEIVGDATSDAYLVNHTASVYLIDADGAFVGTIAWGEDPQAAKDKIERLVGR